MKNLKRNIQIWASLTAILLLGMTRGQAQKLELGLSVGGFYEEVNGTGFSMPDIYLAPLESNANQLGFSPGLFVQYPILDRLALRLDLRYRQQVIDLSTEGNLRVDHLELPLTVNYDIGFGIGAFAGVSLKRALKQEVNYLNPPSLFRTVQHFDALMGAYQENQWRMELGLDYSFGRWSLRGSYHGGLRPVFSDVQLGEFKAKRYEPDIRTTSFQLRLNYLLIFSANGEGAIPGS